MNRIKRMIAIVMLGVFIMLLPLSALAAGVINLNKDVSLTIHYTDGDRALSNAKFSLYLVATVDKYGELTVVDDFKDFSVDIRGENDEAWKALASTLEGYILRDKVSPTDSGVTDSEGKLSFPTEKNELTAGLYLVLGERHKQNGYRYDPQPFMVMLPTQDMENNVWLYQVAANVKYDKDKKPTPPTPEFVTRKVLKVWDDNDSESRPKSITVQLLRDGEVYDSVVLNKENNWRYTWADLSDEFKWNVVEKVPSGYQVSIIKEGVTFVVTNTHNDNTPDEPDTPPPDNPPNNPPDNPPDNPNNPDNPTNPSTPNEPNLPDTPIIPETPTLPQTGQLWWPVPMLITAGLFLIVLGLVAKRISE